MSLTVSTFNVNSVRARLPILTDWLDRVRPDVLCLQETKAQDHDFPVDAFRERGYEVVFRGQKSYNGVAIASRHPIDSADFGFDDGGSPDETRLAIVQIRGISIVNTYIPQGRAPDDPMFAVKLAWLGRLRDRFERAFHPDASLIWVGDFNVAPEPIDVHDPKRLLGHVCYHPEAHRALAEVKDWGFVDVFRKHEPGPGQYTFYDYRAKDPVRNGRGWRVDHIWATAPMADRSTRAWIDLEPRQAERPSDHTPLLATFDV